MTAHKGRRRLFASRRKYTPKHCACSRRHTRFPIDIFAFEAPRHLAGTVAAR